jgi:hypothetical protein
VRFPRRTSPPPEVREVLPRGQKLLAYATTHKGEWLLGTRDYLVVARPEAMVDEPDRRVSGAGTAELIPWQAVERADWDNQTDRLRLVQVAEYGEPMPLHSFAVDDPTLLLQLIRERVTASVVLVRRFDVEGRRGLSVVARRPPSGGEITWAYELDEGVDPADPVVRTAMERALAAAQDELGM